MLPASPHPTLTNPQTLRAAAALPAAGAWDAAPTEIVIAINRTVTLWFAYTRGAAGGAFDFQIQTSPYGAVVAGVENWFDQSIYQPGAVGGGADVMSLIQREYIRYTATDANTEDFVYGPITLAGDIERFRVRAREAGDVDNPGTLHIVGTLFTL